ncbi:MAG: F0F1 ATP synthase subunit B [Myxococcales bacterium FL481]|nr:MAG: F0F1 ATP synthase subunit B [Myxococcales bacterium FL481]
MSPMAARQWVRRGVGPVVAFGATLYCRLAWASPAADSHPHGIKWVGLPTEDDPRVGFIFVLINFAVLLFLLNRILFRPLMASNAKKSDDIREQLDKATQAREQAETLLREYQSKLEGADAEAKALVDAAREAAQAERLRLLDDARQEAQRIVDAATRTIERETRLAVRLLEGEVVDGALARAESVLRQQFNQDDQQRIIDRYVTQVDEIDRSQLGKVS